MGSRERDGRNERDLILAPNEYAFILDETKGNIINYVGPHKTSLANTDQPVIFNVETKKFERCLLEQSIQNYAIAPEGWYLVLKNPARDGNHPRQGTANTLPDLNVGRKVNIPGPVSFAPWPGQMIRVIKGHHLRSNQYLVVRVYDEEGAKANWGRAVIKPQTLPPAEGSEIVNQVSDVKEDASVLTLGKLFIIKGTDVSFYIPPTGIEVVPDVDGTYVRDAVTLERLEYTILLDEDGQKRYIKGPAVVFPHPTEKFIEQDNSRKFRAIELNEISGLYIKVIAPYEENGREYKEGEELFITGKDQMIYFPRAEHAIIRYGEREINYGVAIPAGEARYVLDRINGQIALMRGPTIFLPDPRKEVIVRRVLTAKQVQLWFPGNQEAIEYNQRLAAKSRGGDFVTDRAAREDDKDALDSSYQTPPGEQFAGDKITRKQKFTPPRTITLDTKYEGAVSINVWTGYAVMVVNKSGERKVIVGPTTHILEYDEILESMELSSGTPKTDANTIKTVYLRVLHNKVSDIIEAETKDLVEVMIHLSHRVNFEGDPEKWFDVENYVRFLTDHTRSIMRNAVRQYGIEEFYENSITIIRDTILGKTREDGKRNGLLFAENGMRIYDVEVLDVIIGADAISALMIDSQHDAVQQALELKSEKRRQEVTEEKELIQQKIAQMVTATSQLLLDLELQKIEKQLAVDLSKIGSQIQAEKSRLTAQLDSQDSLDKIRQAELARKKAEADLAIAIAKEKLEQTLTHLRAEVDALVSKAGAVSPQLIAALQAFSDKELAQKMADSMSPLAILGGESVAEVFGRLLQGTILERVLSNNNGHITES